MPDANAIDQIADDAAEDEPEGDLATEGMNVEMMAFPDKDHQGSERDQSEDAIVAAKHAPGSARVLPMHKFKEAI